MDCKEFKTNWNNGDINSLESEQAEKLLDHFHSCESCQDDSEIETLEKRGVIISDYPCVHMANFAEFYCEDHSNPKDCWDATIHYNEIYDEYSIPHGDGISKVGIKNCPWCGTALPESNRDQWFDKLESLGFDDPWEQDIPEKFKSKAWRFEK